MCEEFLLCLARARAVLSCAGGCDEVTPDEVVLELQQNHAWGAALQQGRAPAQANSAAIKPQHGSSLLGLCLSLPAAAPCLSNTCLSQFTPPLPVVAQCNYDLSLTWKIHTQLRLTPTHPWQQGFKLSLNFAALICILGITLKTLKLLVLKPKKQQLSGSS